MLSCSVSPVIRIPRPNKAVTTSPRPWFHSWVVLCSKVASVSTYVPPSVHTSGNYTLTGEVVVYLSLIHIYVGGILSPNAGRACAGR